MLFFSFRINFVMRMRGTPVRERGLFEVCVCVCGAMEVPVVLLAAVLCWTTPNVEGMIPCTEPRKHCLSAIRMSRAVDSASSSISSSLSRSDLPSE